MTRLHHEEIDTGVDLVRRLLRAQQPRWAELSIEPSPERGTDHAIYRLGDDLAVRLPTIHWAAGQPAKEHRWLPALAPHLPLDIPVPLALGVPGEGFPHEWVVVPWLDGNRATEDAMPEVEALIADIVAFTTALQTVDPTGGPRPIDRDLALIHRNATVRAAIAATRAELDGDAVAASWEASLAAPVWDDVGVWVHGDLAPGNVLSRSGRLTGVIDWGAACVADRARDVLCAWNFYGGEYASQFRAAFDVDDATWLRARGFALSGAIESIVYYGHTDRHRVSVAHRILDKILAED